MPQLKAIRLYACHEGVFPFVLKADNHDVTFTKTAKFDENLAISFTDSFTPKVSLFFSA
jgi:hypothetical protein